jgi:hypothetical protein
MAYPKEDTMELQSNNGHATLARGDSVRPSHQEEPHAEAQPTPRVPTSTHSPETTQPSLDGHDQGEEAHAESATPEAGSQEPLGRDYESSFFTKLEALLRNTDPAAPGFFTKDKSMNPMGRLVNLGRKLSEIDGNPILYRQAGYAADLIAKGGLCLPPALNILDDIDFSTSKNSPIYVVMKGVVDALKILVFLFGSLVIGTWLVFLASSAIWSPDQIHNTMKDFVEYLTQNLLATPIFFSTLFGVLGSVVSIILRLAEFERSSRKSRQFLKMTGMLLPIVGGVFATVSCAIFRSGVISFFSPTNSSNDVYFYIVIGFLSGFSERFTRSLLVSLEDLTATRRQQQTMVDPSSGVTKTDEKIVEVRKTKS